MNYVTAPDPRLDAIQVRLDAATLGLWEHFPITGKWSGVRVAGKAGYAELDPHDAAFIANAPADVAYLLAELRKAHAALGKVGKIADGMESIAAYKFGVLGYLDSMAVSLRQHAADLRAAVADATGGGES